MTEETPGNSVSIDAVADLPVVQSVDLSKYRRVGRFDLPEPTRTSPPANSLLAQEASAVTYNWDTDTLFVVGDGGTSIVQVSKTGQLIDSMTLALGNSPQGTDFFDTEGVSYVGGGRFVMVEERYRQADLFTYVPGAILHKAGAQSVKLGTTIGNIGLEGVSYDPSISGADSTTSGGYIFVKEMDPESIFLSGIDFAAGTATNGSPSATSSFDLFNPGLANLADFSDIFALSNLPSLAGQPDYSHLLVLSQESGQIINIDRSGNIFSKLTIVADPGNPLAVADQTHEGMTMDRNGYLYVVSENGGGDSNHPQLWVYAPSTDPNLPPTAITLSSTTTSIPENTSTAAPIKVATIIVNDDGLGTNNLSVSGVDAGSFQIIGTALYLKAGTGLNSTTKPSYEASVNVDDPGVGSSIDATTPFSLAVTAATAGTSSLIISEVSPWSSGNSPIGVDWFEVTNTGTAAANITGWRMDDNSNSFASSVALNGISSIVPGESVIFLETTDLAGKSAAFKTLWFGANSPGNIQIGSYSGSGVGLSTGGDAVNLFDTAQTIKAKVSFGPSPAAPFSSFDNAIGLNGVTISTLSAVGINGAFAALGDANEIGSPGTLGAPPAPIISIVATDANALETGNDPGTFRISRTGSTVGPLSVSYTIAAGAGKASGTDYTPTLNGLLTIPSGQAYADLTITPVTDNLIEGTEVLTLNLGDSGSYDVGAQKMATVTIADPNPFLGVAAGDASGTSAILWTRVSSQQSVGMTAQVSADADFGGPILTYSITSDSTKDNTAKVNASQLSPGTQYFYRFVIDGTGQTSGTGTFKTTPAVNVAAPLHFAFSGDNDGLMRPFALASVIPEQHLDFYVNLGDVIYENASNVKGDNGASWLNSPSVTLSNDSLSFNGIPRAFIPGGTPFATQAQLKADYEKKYRENFLPVNTAGQNGLQVLYASQGNYTTWDNHELGNRKYIDGGAPAGGSVGGPTGTDMATGRGVDARAYTGSNTGGSGNINNGNDAADLLAPSDLSAIGGFMNKSAGFQTLERVFLSYQPIADRGTISAPSDPRTDGTEQLYAAVPWGKNALYINTDTRSYRDIRLKTANGSADDTGSRADNPNRTYLGDTQLAWLKQTLLDAQTAGTPWKFVSLSDPIDQIGPIGGALSNTLTPVNSDGGKSYMGGYRAERNDLLKFIADNKISNVVFLSTDDHQNRINELYYSPTGQTGLQSSYVKVPNTFSIVCGPLGATGPDLITDHSFDTIKAISDSLANAQKNVGIDPIGLENYPGLHNLVRENDPTAGSSPQPADFYSPDTFNFTVLDVSADGKTLSVKSVGMNSTAQNAGTEYPNGPQARTIFSFAIDANQAPTAVSLSNTVSSLAENSSTSSPIKVADITIVDDGLGMNVLSLSGKDSSFFVIDNNSLYLKPGTVLDFEAKPTYTITVTADDDAVGGTPDASAEFTLNLIDQNEAPSFTSPESFSVSESNTLGVTGPSSSASPYVLSASSDVQLTSILTTGDSIGSYRMVGIPDGLGAFDNGDGTFTLLMNQELGNSNGIIRDHGAKGAFVSKWIINKSDLRVVSGSDLMKTVYGWNKETQASAGPITFAFNRFCSGDLPMVSAYSYDPTPGDPNSGDEVGTFDRIYMHGEEGGSTGYQLGSVVTGVDAGKTYILGKFNLSTNASGLSGVGAWENALANPFAQSKTVVIGDNDGGSGIMNNTVSVYVGTKTNSGSAVDKAGLTNGTLQFIAVDGHNDSNGSTTEEYSNATTHASLITSGTRFSLNSTASTTFSRPEDGAWNPLNPNQYYFVTTDRLDTVSDGIGSQIGQSRLWRLTFDDITNPDAGGTIDLLIDGRTVNSEKANMFDNITVNPTTGNLILLEDVGDAAHNGKVWEYNPASDTLTKIAQHDRARFGDIGLPATSPFSQDEETSGVVDVSSILGPGSYLVVDQAHYLIDATHNGQGFTNPDELVEGGQLMLLRTNVASGQQLVTTLTASDPEGAPLTYSIAGGDDASRFTVDATTGALSFKVAPNYETPTDGNGDNLYQVMVAVSDGINPPVNQALLVNVTNVNELPRFTSLESFSVKESNTLGVTGSSSSASPYVVSRNPEVQLTSLLTVGDSIGGYTMVGIPDGLGAFDNGDGTFTLLMNHELGNTSGILRDHGAKGAFVSEWIINKSDLRVLSGDDLMKNVYGWNSTTQQSNRTTSTIAFNRFCSGDLPQASAYYYDPTPGNPNSGDEVGSTDRIYMHGEEGGSTGYQLASVASGADAGNTYILGKFNLSTNGSGLPGVGAWENALANPFAQAKTVVIGNNDGGTGIMSNSVSVYVGIKTNSGSAADRAGLTNGLLKFVTVAGNPTEIVDTTTRATNIANSSRFSLSSTASTAFSRPEDGAWNPLNPNQYYFVTTDRLDTVSDGIGSQIGQSRLWRLTFDDITNPDAGGKIDLLIDGRTVNGEKVNMFDNLAVNPTTGHLVLLEDVGNAPHNGKVWDYDPSTDILTQLAQHDRARFGDVGLAANPPFNQDEETSGVIDVSSILGAGSYLLVDQAHSTTGQTTETVEGGQLMLLRTNVASGQQLVTTLTASDPEGAPLSYSIAGGADAARFMVDATTGALSFKVAPNYEAPTDGNGDNRYQVTVAVSDGVNQPVNQPLIVSVTNVNEVPTNTTAQAVSVAENTSAVTTASGTDPEGASLTFAIDGGADASRFTINPTTGDLSFITPPDFEAPSDNGVNNSYFVTVTVSDGDNAPVNRSVRVGVTDVNEAPTALALSATSFDENIPDGSRVATLSGSDPDQTPQSFTYSLVPGTGDTDNLAFSIAGNELHITRSPDYEKKSSYNIRLKATDQGGLSFERSVQLSVKDLPDSASYTFSKSADTVYEGGALAIGVSSSNVAPGTQIYWSFSGTGITSSDVSDGVLSGTSTLGADGRASFTKTIASDGVVEGDEGLEVKFFSDSARTQQLGTTLTVSLKEPSVGGVNGATDRPDIITGTAANELISGIPSGSIPRGMGTVDKLTGGGGDDDFALGDDMGIFYDDGLANVQGTTDMAWITDFSAGDKIRLHGNPGDYQLSSSRYSGSRGVQINAFLPGSLPEPICFVQSATLANLQLANPSQFQYI